MKLGPGVLGVIDIGAHENQSISDARPRQMAVVAGHELDHEVATFLGGVLRHQDAAVLAIEIHQDMDVSVLFIADVVDRAGDAPARVADGESIGVVDALKRLAYSSRSSTLGDAGDAGDAQGRIYTG